MESNKNVKSGHQNGKPKAFCARCGTESMKKCFLSWLKSTIYQDKMRLSRGGEENYATVIMGPVMFADGTNSEASTCLR